MDLRNRTWLNIGAWFIIAAFVGLMLAFFTVFAHGTTTTPSARTNSLGLSQTYTNPYEYMFGTIEHVDAFSTVSNVVFRPFGASLLNTQTILFCGDVTKALGDGDTNTLYVFTYRQQASRTFQGVACHDVYRILELGEAK